MGTFQRLLDATGGGDDQEKEFLAKVGGGAPKVLQDGTYATETALTSGAAAKLEAVKAAAKPAMRGVCFHTFWC
jgi:coatomer subunit beta